jgi:hypothetical protein
MIFVYYFDFSDYFNDHYVLYVDSIYNRHFLPYGRRLLYDLVKRIYKCTILI